VSHMIEQKTARHTFGSSWAGLSWFPIPRLASTDPALSYLSALSQVSGEKRLTSIAEAGVVCLIKGPPAITPDNNPRVSFDGGAVGRVAKASTSPPPLSSAYPRVGSNKDVPY
jgi:hypothetical protein